MDAIKRFVSRYKPQVPYAVPLDVIIKRSVKRMKIKPECPFCGTRMMFRFSNLSRFGHPLREDQCWKCPNCFYTATFGVPLTRTQWQEEYKIRRGVLVMRPDLRKDERTRKDVIKRLKKLGYLDVEK